MQNLFERKDEEQNPKESLMAVAGRSVGLGSLVGVLGLPCVWNASLKCKGKHIRKHSFGMSRLGKKQIESRLVINPSAHYLPQ